jgi:hypothetical protein
VKHYEASSIIAAPPETVWDVLVDGSRYPEWDSGVTRIEGPIVDGGRIKAYAAVSPGRAFPVTVTLDRPRLMSWTGGMPLGLFRGHRTFALAGTPDGGTRFTMREEYTGPLLGLIWRSMPDLGPSFVQFVNGLKAQAEAQQPAP